MIQLWRLWRGGGMGAGFMPDAGGAMDQPVIMIACFTYMNGVAQAIKDNGVSARLA